MSRTVRVLACGSIDGGDDAAGLLAVRRLPLAATAGAAVEEVGQLSAEMLLDDPPDAIRLVVDCVHGLPAGSVVDLPLAVLPELELSLRPASTHALSPGQAVALASRLGGVHPEDRFLGIGGADFRLGAGPSAMVAGAMRDLVDRVARRVAEARRATAPMVDASDESRETAVRGCV